ncbi:uncharacterized protein BJ171DRAFT_517612 [Polychytrium aggregatum]|uniref:uncharacterized protein n=1 Tax=Polychytrium aggregatum TaxID=110093 RepID=UPI0022FDE040|nr:uncharacterized protein BJ171DRAFT_517612 [Polychytrium aggregatum]KAI9199722.1 hypothetical protein BJ171DRAFT_517612 [Polychytrium aggregatum]
MRETGRAKAFSAKQKKKQLQEKRLRKSQPETHHVADEHHSGASDPDDTAPFAVSRHRPPGSAQNRRVRSGSDAAGDAGGTGDADRMRKPRSKSRGLESKFVRMPHEAMEALKQQAQQPFHRLDETGLEVDYDSFYPESAIIPLPKRPAWSYDDSKEVLEEREQSYFQSWIESVHTEFQGDHLSYFEQNLEVWRQLWRVCEISDIILVVVDSRNPVLHFPPALHEYICKDLGKDVVLVFNKVDLVPRRTLLEWQKYFEGRFPGLKTACFSMYPKESFAQRGKRVRFKRYARAYGTVDILNACKSTPLTKEGTLVEWDSLIEEQLYRVRKYEAYQASKAATREKQDGFLGRSRRRQRLGNEKLEYDGYRRGPHGRDSDDDEVSAGYKRQGHSGVEQDDASSADSSVDDDDDEPLQGELESDPAARSDVVTIGMLGHPNVGKSSLINSLMGKKVVSTSKTPGHTKHFQTIHLAPRVRLCDCPGLVFPSLIPPQLQILSGMYKIAQVQEPYSVVQYLAERIPLETILGVSFIDDNDNKVDSEEDRGPREWSAWKICEAFAIQRGFLTARAARPDVYRAANLILRMACEGKIPWAYRPAGYFSLQTRDEEEPMGGREIPVDDQPESPFDDEAESLGNAESESHRYDVLDEVYVNDMSGAN